MALVTCVVTQRRTINEFDATVSVFGYDTASGAVAIVRSSAVGEDSADATAPPMCPSRTIAVRQKRHAGAHRELTYSMQQADHETEVAILPGMPCQPTRDAGRGKAVSHSRWT